MVWNEEVAKICNLYLYCSQVLRRQTTDQEIPVILIDLSTLEVTFRYNRIKIIKPKVYN